MAGPTPAGDVATLSHRRSPGGTAATGRRKIRIVPVVAYALALAVLGYFLSSGWSFYTTPLPLRPRHPDYWILKPGGDLGRMFGIIGAGMMTLLLLYSVRRRVKLLRGLGMLSRWLDVHIFFGTIGPLFIVLHTSFKVHGIVAVSFWSMVAVAASGLFGRYLYQQIPRNRAGDELSLEELAELDKRLSARLGRQFELDEGALQKLRGIADAQGAESASLFGALLRTAIGDLTLRWRLRRAVRGLGLPPGKLLQELKALIRERALLRRRIVLWNRMQELFFYWHVLHKPFALMMYVFMFVHILVAVLTGYGFGGGV